MYHSITFGTGEIDWTGQADWKNTWDSWHLIPSSRPTLALPKYAEKYIEIPGMDGSYDFTTWLTGRPVFADRTGNFDFLIDNDHEHWVTIYRNIATYLHGKKMKMILEDDPAYYYEGRFTVGNLTPDKSNSKITINYRVGPYKYSMITHGAEDIVWDIFGFEQDNDWYHFNDLHVDGYSYTYELPPHYMFPDNPVQVDAANMPIPGYDFRYAIHLKCLEVDGSVNIDFNGQRGFLTAVDQEIDLGPSILGKNRLILSGTGRVSISFRDASL